MRPTQLTGARTHNLKGIDLTLQPGELVVVAGPSGAGKSSLAFSTLYAEGQRRYVESFSAYARQFLERRERPPVEFLDPVPAAVAVDRQAPVRTSRSTVGTMTEIADHAKALWAKGAIPRCDSCGEDIVRDSPEQIADRLLTNASGARLALAYPCAVDDPEEFLRVRERWIRDGYRRLHLDGAAVDLDRVPPSQALAASPVHVLVDRTRLDARYRSRIVDGLEAAFRRSRSEGRRSEAVAFVADESPQQFSSELHCARCDVVFDDPSPAVFSFNSPIGACETCRGFGRVITVDWDRVMPDRTLSVNAGGIRAMQGKSASWERAELKKFARRAGVSLDKPLEKYTRAEWHWLIEGDEEGYPSSWFGLRTWFDWMESRAYKMHVRVFLSRYRKYETCGECQGTRLKPTGLRYRLEGRTIADFFRMPVAEAIEFLGELNRVSPALATLRAECERRLLLLAEVGLSYLTLDRASRTLSGGETQRVALTSALGASLNGSMFVLDEPTVGLHPRDVERLLGVVRRLAERDNIALVVEHDPQVIAAADRVVELGPGAGDEGGQVVFDGTPAKLRRASTKSGVALRRRARPHHSPRTTGPPIVLRGARGNNLRDITLEVPTQVLTVVTGVSGSGKSSLILQTLAPAVEKFLGGGGTPLEYRSLRVPKAIRAMVRVDQAPLGRTSRGNPASYLKIWDGIRTRFSKEPLAKERGYGPGMFSFNSPTGGRCETCKGQGAETVEMQFLADVTFSCADCGGRRFRGPVLDVRYRDHSIADVLELTATAARDLFEGDRKIQKGLASLIDVGLGYLRLGQSLSTLSSGEAQRVKLAAALKERPRAALIVLDEPTAGLHAVDVVPLLDAIDGLVDEGNTVVVVEHDMEVARRADHVIDLGPGAGTHGGELVYSGPTAGIGSAASSVTAPYLLRALRGTDKRVGEAPERRRRTCRIRTDDESAAIGIRGADEHNLKSVDVEIPLSKLSVVTGPSGSGKSSLAFDVLYAEGQRRYLETLTPYARQYLPQLPRPNVQAIDGVLPSVSLEQRTTRGGSNSTVATVTEVAHYYRLLYARLGVLHCPDCDVAIAPRPTSELYRELRKRLGRRRVSILYPYILGRKGNHRVALAAARKKGFERALIDGELRAIEGLSLDRYREHDVDLEVHHGTLDEDAFGRALLLGQGVAKVVDRGTPEVVSNRRACGSCGRGFPELDPRFFSFNTRQGGCERCEGRGEIVRVRGRGASANEERVRCRTCDGTRLSPLARAVKLDGVGIAERLADSVDDAVTALDRIRLSSRAKTIAEAPLAELRRLLTFLSRVGLGYLHLDRSASTLSGGELQRVRLSAQLGAGLTGVLYVLDEPTIGLHPRDTEKLIGSLRALVKSGNTVLVVEHDADLILAADHVIDMGPSGGRLGGEIVAEGTPAELRANPASITGPALAREATLPEKRRSVSRADWLSLRGARQHNLKNVDVRFPVGRLSAVTGVSGSGKSTLVREVFLPALRRALGNKAETPGAHRSLEGVEAVRRAVEIDQRPIGRTPRSVPATYVGVWNELRKLLAATPEARARGYQASRFSFNVKGGRCDHCDGQGALTVEMSFLPPVLTPCERCGSRRFNRETLEVRLLGMTAADILALEVSAATDALRSFPKIRRPLELFSDLGLGYLTLGQPSNTLSGGEAQRLKLVTELSRRGPGGCVYVMDEPTTGLHRDDVTRLIQVMQRLVDRGDTVVVIEHHPDVILAADYVVDLGPDGGRKGGKVVSRGNPEQIMASKKSHTGEVLRGYTRRR
ncbi:MAG: excinuclease ABC subunit UvrA [Myxococcota bacterium]